MKIKSFLIVFLNILRILIVITTVGLGMMDIGRLENFKMEYLVIKGALLIFMIMGIIGITLLLRVLGSLDEDPICLENATRFNRIGYVMLIMTLLDIIMQYRFPTLIAILGTGYGSIKVSGVVYLIVACVSFVISEVFKRAVAIKNENDLTI